MVINIQSFSDIITNSSSEIFCTIKGDTKIIEQAYDILRHCFEEYGDPEEAPKLEYYTKEEAKDWYDEETLGKLSDKFIIITLPYSHPSVYRFYKAGIQALLGDFLNDQITIDYDD